MSAQTRIIAFAAALVTPATGASAETDALFPPATAGCYVGTEITPAAARPDRKPAVAVTAVRLLRGYPELAHEEEDHPPGGGRTINLRVVVTFADSSRPGALKRYANGPNDLLRCSAEMCDANNYKVERQADGSVLLRMTGGMYIGGGTYRQYADRHLPDGHLYRLVASPMSACF